MSAEALLASLEDDAPPSTPPVNVVKFRRGGRRRLFRFAQVLREGKKPIDAFIEAGYPILGMRMPDGTICEKGGWTPEGAERRAFELAQDPRVHAFIAQMGAPARARTTWRHGVAVAQAVLMKRMLETNVLGFPTSGAQQAADSWLDRAGEGRGSKVKHEHGTSEDRQREYGELVDELREALSTPENAFIETTARVVESKPGSNDGEPGNAGS